MINKTSRTRAAGKNLRANAAGIFINIFFSFFSRKIFVLVLGKEYVGLTSLIGNITVLISLFDFGSAAALTFKLYTAIAQNDTKKISSYLHYYRIFCIVSAILTSLVGITITPQLKKIVPDFSDTMTLYTVFLISIFSNALEYFFSAEKLLLFADQKNYVTQLFSYAFGAITLVIQSAALVVRASFPLYLATGSALCILQDFLICRHVRKSYREIDFRLRGNFDKSCRKVLLREMLRLQPSNIAATISRTIDNFLVVSLFGVAQNGLYSNYNLLLGYAGMLSVTFVSSISAGVGNLSVQATKEHSQKVFGMISLASFFLINICATLLFVMAGDIVTMWLGKSLVLPTGSSAVVAVCFFISANRRTTIVFRDSFGLYSHEKLKPFAELLIFVALAVICGIKYGLIGIYLAQALSAVSVFWYEPYVLFKYGFGTSSRIYFKKFLVFVGCNLLSCYCAFNLCRCFDFIVLKAIVCVTVSVAFFIVMLANCEEADLLKEKLKGKKKCRSI